eukprot:maker-scaffold3901_size7175-snap-gene-0.1 protein:Tk02942 transcript:maker-scaffold3901_size7175-snap-gene-0.1-mRNA-1 annotation:"PREDICTED: uncharacterized protein LOC103512334"
MLCPKLLVVLFVVEVFHFSEASRSPFLAGWLQMDMSTLPPETLTSEVCPDASLSGTETLATIATLEKDKCYELTSQNFPENYPNGNGNYKCRYEIKLNGGITGVNVHIMKSEFELQANADCSPDYLEISPVDVSVNDDDNKSNAANTVRYCGLLDGDKDLNLTAGDDVMIISFKANTNQNFKGFRL